MGRFITKNTYKNTSKRPYTFQKEKVYENNELINEDMNTKEKVEIAAAILAQDTNTYESKSIKKVKQEKGLIERTESSKIILTEDNRELLKD